MHPVEALLLPVGWLRNRRPDEGASIANAPELATTDHITLTSSAFRDGQVVPAKYCGQFIGDDSPALSWSALPTGTKGLVFVLEDLDNPGATPGIHTVAARPSTPGRGRSLGTVCISTATTATPGAAPRTARRGTRGRERRQGLAGRSDRRALVEKRSDPST